MKELEMYVVLDRVSNVRFSDVILAQNDTVALLGFAQFARNQEEKTHVSPKCYSLYRIGSIDESGKIVDSDYRLICHGDQADEMYNAQLQEAFEREESAIVE